MTSDKRDELIERLAELSHQQWADWATWMMEKWDQSRQVSPGQCETYQSRWRRQIATPYSDLSLEEQESDRIEARRIWAVVEGSIAEQGGLAGAYRDLQERHTATFVDLQTCRTELAAVMRAAIDREWMRRLVMADWAVVMEWDEGELPSTELRLAAIQELRASLARREE